MGLSGQHHQHCFRRMIRPAQKGYFPRSDVPNSPSRSILLRNQRARSIEAVARSSLGTSDDSWRLRTPSPSMSLRNRQWSSHADLSQGHYGSNNHSDDNHQFRRTSLGVIVAAGAAALCNDDRKNNECKASQREVVFVCRGIRLEPETRQDAKEDKPEEEAQSDDSSNREANVGPQDENVNGDAEKDQSPLRKLVRQHSLKAEQDQLEHQSSDIKVSNNEIPGEEEEDDELVVVVEAKDDSKGCEVQENKDQKAGFRERKIIDYENRIRAYSAPDKIFRYFATYKSVTDGEIFMTPGDFLRSLTPGVKQPDGLGLDQFRKFDPSQSNRSFGFDEDIPEKSIFHHLGKKGLICFSDYVFLLTILSTSRRQFEIAFRMFDLNGDGDVDANEFSQIQDIIRQTTASGKKMREVHHGSSQKINSALAIYFFGEAMDGKLTIERFLDFQSRLQSEILALEFQRKEPDEDGNITEKQFAELLLTYANYSSKRRSAVLKRVKKAYKGQEGQGISLVDYEQIFTLLMHIEDVDKALYFHRLAGASIDPSTLRHVAKVCAGVDLSAHVVQVLFTIFDDDCNGGLSNKEFIAVMKNKLKRGLEKPKDTGLMNLFAAMTKCAIINSPV